ncbi:MAG: RNA methyltransferase [Nibricoccus sp.]
MLSKAEIARLKSLREKKHRDALGLFVVEGEKVVAELLSAGHPFCELYFTPRWVHSRPENVTVHSISEEDMARISHYPTPSPVFAVGKIVRLPVRAEELNRGLTLLLDGLQDAGNLGTLLRIADWYAFDRVVASQESVDFYNQKVINASMGSFSRVKFHSASLPALLSEVSVPVLGCDLEGESVHKLARLQHAVVAIGSEGRGLSEAVKTRVTQFVTIPRFGSAESLNAAVAAAVVCDNLRRKSGEL